MELFELQVVQIMYHFSAHNHQQASGSGDWAPKCLSKVLGFFQSLPSASLRKLGDGYCSCRHVLQEKTGAWLLHSFLLGAWERCMGGPRPRPAGLLSLMRSHDHSQTWAEPGKSIRSCSWEWCPHPSRMVAICRKGVLNCSPFSSGRREKNARQATFSAP